MDKNSNNVEEVKKTKWPDQRWPKPEKNRWLRIHVYLERERGKKSNWWKWYKHFPNVYQISFFLYVVAFTRDENSHSTMILPVNSDNSL